MTEDPLESYLNGLRSFAERAITARGTWQIIFEFLEMELRAGNAELAALINWRQDQMTAQDRAEAAGFLTCGFFAGHSDEFRAAVYLVSLEMDRQRRAIKLRRSLERYRQSDPVFSSGAKMLGFVSKRNEMVDARELRQERRSGLLAYGTSFVKVSGLLNPEILSFVRSHAPASTQIEVRLDPDYPGGPADPPFASYTPELPIEFLKLIADVPLSRFIQTRRWAVPIPGVGATDARNFAEYFAAGLRALETTAVHDGARTEIYFEEIEDAGGIYIDMRDGGLRERTEGPVLGRMIHFDTESKASSAARDVTLIHLDLALNVYDEGASRARLTTELPQRVEASRRIHLFKAAPLPMHLLPGIAYLFFRSWRLLYKALAASRDMQ